MDVSYRLFISTGTKGRVDEYNIMSNHRNLFGFKVYELASSRVAELKNVARMVDANSALFNVICVMIHHRQPSSSRCETADIRFAKDEFFDDFTGRLIRYE